MKKLLLILIPLLLLGASCTNEPQTKTVKGLNWCEDALINSLYTEGSYEIRDCKVVDFDGDGYYEVALLEIDQDELYGNGVFSLYKYNLTEAKFEELLKQNKDVDSQMTMQVGDMDEDGKGELLVNQYFGASGSTLEYDLFFWEDNALAAAFKDNRTYNNQEKYLEGEETWASKFDAQIYDGYIVESFKTLTDEDAHCCPSGRNVAVYFKFVDGDLIEEKVESEDISIEY